MIACTLFLNTTNQCVNCRSVSTRIVLKGCDPTAYRCAKSDYESDFDLDDCTEYTDMVGELESLESDLRSLENYLEIDLESFLESSESYLESLKAK